MSPLDTFMFDWFGDTRSEIAVPIQVESRVEVVTPVEEPALREELRAILDAQLGDRRSAWDMRPDGSYLQRQPGNGAAGGSQQALIASAEARHYEATRLRKRRPQTIARRPERAL